MVIYSTKRTNKTDLSDVELCLFDLLFDANSIVNGLIKEVSEQGLGCEKRLVEPVEFVDIANKLIEKGLIKLKLISLNKKVSSVIGLTPKGGEVWETEREPIWDKYVMDLCSDENGFWELNVISPSFEIAQEFIKISHKCKLYEMKNLDSVHCDQICSDETHIPWKNFTKLYKISSKLVELGAVDDATNNSVNWETYRNSLGWWRSVSELQLLKNDKK